MADSALSGFTTIDKAKKHLGFVDSCSLCSPLIHGENNFEKAMLHKMSPERILSGFAIQKDGAAGLVVAKRPDGRPQTPGGRHLSGLVRAVGALRHMWKQNVIVLYDSRYKIDLS